MKTSRKDFLRLLGGGSTLAGAAVYGTRGPVLWHRTANLPAEAGVIPAPEQITNPFAGIPEHFETCEERIYDSIRFLPGQVIPQHWYLFQVPYGQRCPFSGQYKDRSFTNMDMCGMLPAPSSFWIRKINFSFGNMVADRETLEEYSWNLWISQKHYDCGSLRWDTDKTREYPMTAGLWIPMQCQFNMSFESKASHILSEDGQGASLYVEFEGISVRGVA